MKTVIYKTLDNSLMKKWQNLWNNTAPANIFNSPGWTKAYIESYFPEEIKIITLQDDTGIVGILPLVKERYLGINAYVTIGNKFSHRCTLLGDLSNKKLARALIQELIKSQPVYLGHLNDRELNCFISAYPEVCLLQSESILQMPLFSPDGNFTISKRRQILKKARDEEKYLKLTRSIENKVGLNTVFNIDDKSSKSQNKYNVFGDKKHRDFYIKLVNYLGENIVINFLYRKNIPVAYELGFSNGDTYIDSERAYLFKHSHYTPGKVLIVKLAEDLAKRGYKVLDLGPGIDNFKNSLTKNHHRISDIAVIKNPLTRLYILNAVKIRKRVYNAVFANTRIYSLYKSVINSIQNNN
jgi:CelD/BcsL family acetyltransferase involved in cellulose biosynthesis